jgi:hypothetical protein
MTQEIYKREWDWNGFPADMDYIKEAIVKLTDGHYCDDDACMEDFVKNPPEEIYLYLVSVGKQMLEKRDVYRLDDWLDKYWDKPDESGNMHTVESAFTFEETMDLLDITIYPE